jgi:F-type H+-transporting ATPase subunit a
MALNTAETLLVTEYNELEAIAKEAHAHHELPNFITFLNESFGDNVIVQFLHAWQNIFFSLVAASLLVFIFLKAAKLDEKIPGGLRNFIEVIVEGLENFVISITGEGGRKHVPFLGTLFMYILLMNWSGMVPFLKSPTAYWSITLALAILATLYIHISGIIALGIGGYLHHVAGSPKGFLPWVIGVIFIFPIMLILDWGALPFSLSLRLFANISSEDGLLYNFAQLNAQTNFLAMPLQIFANLLAIMFSLIQAFVFTLLTTVYISLFMPHDDHEHEAQHAH